MEFSTADPGCSVIIQSKSLGNAKEIDCLGDNKIQNEIKFH